MFSHNKLGISEVYKSAIQLDEILLSAKKKKYLAFFLPDLNIYTVYLQPFSVWLRLTPISDLRDKGTD